MKIGINIHCKTAREQDIFIGERESRQYYHDCFYYGLMEKVTGIMIEHVDGFWTMESDTRYNKDGSCLNSVVFVLDESSTRDVKILKAKLRGYVSGYFDQKFKNDLIKVQRL